jgi:D-glucosaminate-6-phosphate ammonia-lyase
MVGIYNPYKKFGLRRVVNAAGTLTRIGGSISPSEVFSAMEDASQCFVHIPELQQWAGRIIAESTGAEAGLPTAGSSNAITLAAAACIMKGTELEKYDPLEQETWIDFIQRLPMRTEGLKTDFIVQRSNRNVYDHAVECAGGRFVEVGTVNGTDEIELHESFDPERTAAYYITDRSSDKRMSLAKVVEIAHSHEVPVIVDAASELPPKRNLKRYISKGADMVVISGGKFIAGPNNSGLLAGREDLIKLAHLNAYPFHGVGRSAKMSRETIVALITALKIYETVDESALFEVWEEKARWMAEQLKKVPFIESGLSYHNTVEEKELMYPICYVKMDSEKIEMTIKDISNMLRNGDPSIEASVQDNKLLINPEFLLEGDESIITQRIMEILSRGEPN